MEEGARLSALKVLVGVKKIGLAAVSDWHFTGRVILQDLYRRIFSIYKYRNWCLYFSRVTAIEVCAQRHVERCRFHTATCLQVDLCAITPI